MVNLVSIKIVGVVLVAMIIVLIDLRGLMQASNPKKVMICYFSIMAINLIISILLISGVEIISPGMVLEKFVRFFIPGEPVQ